MIFYIQKFQLTQNVKKRYSYKLMTQALLIIDHGSKRRAANHMLFDLVKLVRNASPDILVYGAHMELAEPSIECGIEWCISRGATHIIAHPFMLSPGRHAKEDIPNMVKKALEKHPHITHFITDPLGLDDMIVSLILKRSGL